MSAHWPSSVAPLPSGQAYAGTIGFSSPVDRLVGAGERWIITRAIADDFFRPESLDVHPWSAERFDLVYLEVLREATSRAKRALGAEGPIDLGSVRRMTGAGFSPRSVALGIETLPRGSSITIEVQNTSRRPARFRANVVGPAMR